MRLHDLKTWPEPFEALWQGQKVHEVRRDDRGFAVGDSLNLREYEPNGRGSGSYTGRMLRARVTHKTQGGTWGLPPGICVLSLRVEHAEPPTAPALDASEWVNA